MLIKISYLLVALISFSTNANADFIPDDESSKTHKFLFFEGSALAWAWIASEYPHEFGGVTALVTAPIILGNQEANETTNWINFVGLEAISYYNITVDLNKTSKKEIFINNFIAAHLWTGIFGLSEYLIGDKQSKESLAFRPRYNGASLAYNYKF